MHKQFIHIRIQPWFNVCRIKDFDEEQLIEPSILLFINENGMQFKNVHLPIRTFIRKPNRE